MYTNDKINNGGEITSVGKQKILAPFYIMLMPQSGTTDTVAYLNVKLNFGTDYIEFPFPVGSWVPVVLSDINARREDLAKFRIFWGKE